MQRFSDLINDLIYTRSRNEKIDRIARYLIETADPDRGWALASLTNELDFPAVKSGTIRGLISERVDPVLFKLSRDYVGDTAETVSLLWPDRTDVKSVPTLSEAVDLLTEMTRSTVNQDLGALLDRLDADQRFALLKMATGAMRTGVSARLAKLAFAKAFDVDAEDVEEMWHVLEPPYTPLFEWAVGNAPKPDISALPAFRPFMLATPLDEREINLADYAVEWKWDGIRVQLVHVNGETRLYSRSGDDITSSFPDVADDFRSPGVVDGELLVRGSHQGGEEGGAASFNALQQRLGRKAVSAKVQKEYPAFVRLYDILLDGAEDVREHSWQERRTRLEAFMRGLTTERFDLSLLLNIQTKEDLEKVRNTAREAAIEGLMLKRRDSPYVGGRKVGLWYKWKRDPLSADCVLMYAQRGSGKRSSFYSDFTFGCWDAPPEDGGALLPVGKAYFGFTDEELKWLDNFVRKNTVSRFGPVREVAKTLVLEVAFDSIHESKRHKSGVSMRFPRIAHIRHDKPATEADLISNLKALTT